MIKTLLGALLIMGFLGDNTLFAQPDGSQTKELWGKSACGLQISITVSNNIIAAGSNFVLTIKMKNSSTNVIESGESSPETDFKVFLIDDSGKKYQLTPSVFSYTRLLRIILKPGEVRSWSLFLGVNKYYEQPGFNPSFKNIPSGKYTLKATRTYLPCEIESNVLEIQIK